MMGGVSATPALAEPEAPSRPSPSRVIGIDVARALAILGMVMVHFGPFNPDTSTPLGWLYRSSHGRASVLFVLLAGIGVTLLFDGLGRRGGRAKDPTTAWAKVAWRVLLFVPLGVFLQGLDTPVAVILQYYAGYYVVGALASRLPTGWLAALTATWMVVGPTAYVTWFDTSLSGRGVTTDLWDLGGILTDITHAGYYPLITWAPPVLVGVLIGRADLRRRGVQAALAAAGVVTATAAYGASELARATSAAAADSAYLLAEGHTGAPLNVLGATGVAVAVLGLCLLAGTAFPRLVWPLAAVGQMALTVYVGHLLVLHAVPDWLEARGAVEDAVRKVGRFYLVTVLACVAWRARLERGPLEWLLAVPFSAAGRRPPSAVGVAGGPPPVGHPATSVHGSLQWQPPSPDPSTSSPTSSTPAQRPSPPSTPT